MPAKRYRITLTETEREALNAAAAAHSNNSTKTIRVRAGVLLMADEGRAGPGFKDGGFSTPSFSAQPGSVAKRPLNSRRRSKRCSL
jgi:hypothetical protein